MKEVNTVLITGACGGIGKSIVRKFIESDWNVILLDSMNCTFNYEANSKIKQYAVNLSSEESLLSLESEISNETIVNAIVNAVGRYYSGDIYDTTMETFDSCVKDNLITISLVVKHFLKYMVHGGSIVNVASVNAWFPQKTSFVYNVTKGAVISLTRSLARDLGRKGIRVNCIAPGTIDTPPLRNYLKSISKTTGKTENILMRRIEELTLLGRIGNPSEVAEVAYFLATESSSFMTGSILTCDGGLSIKNDA